MKPIRFEYKIWWANLPFRYFFNFTFYEGRTGCKKDIITYFGLGTGVMLDTIHG